MPFGVFKSFFRDHRQDVLGHKLAEIVRLKTSMRAGGFGGSQISRNWRDLDDAEKKLKAEMAERHWKALEKAEHGDREGSIALHRANYDDLFHVADTYEVLAMFEQSLGNLAQAIAIMETGCWVFRELADPALPQRERVLAAMERRLERLRARAGQGSEHARR